MEAEASHLFWPWQAFQHKHYHFVKSQLPHTFLCTKSHPVYYCLTEKEKKSAALTDLCMTLTPSD